MHAATQFLPAFRFTGLALASLAAPMGAQPTLEDSAPFYDADSWLNDRRSIAATD